jgi:hypothetical protein
MERRFSVGGLFVSFLMIAGGLTLTAIPIALVAGTRGWLAESGYFAGAFLGGVFAGRASPRKGVADLGGAVLLLVFTVLGVVSLLPDVGDRYASSSGLPVAVEIALLTGLAGFVGGLVGERTSSRASSSSPWHWSGVAALVYLGLSYLLLGLFAALVLRAMDGAAEQDVAAIVLAGIALGSFGSGFVTQAIAPRRMRWACGRGAFLVALLPFVVAAVTGARMDVVILAAAIIGGIDCVIAEVGAELGWSLVGSRREPAPRLAPAIPKARLE